MKDQQTEKTGERNMQSKRKIRNTSIQNRKLEHRKNHPNDRLSFGEKRVPKIRKKINLKTNIEETILEDIKSPKTNKPKKPKISIEITENSMSKMLVRCKVCGTVTNRHRVRIGDCHTERYGKGWYGQTYSGANGRGRLYGP
ncbi:MAG: hypothetical protein CL987_01580 [Euryarchaeota archaeon]|nr:hypothetical protein [Euryarchaeota archaeon]